MTTPPASIDLTDLAFGDLARLGWRVVRFDPDLNSRLWRPTLYVVPLDFEGELSTETTPPITAHSSTLNHHHTQENNTMRKSDVFPSKYLKQDDVPDEITVTIKRVTIDVVGVGDDAGEKPILHFQEPHVKPMVLNAGNWTAVENAFGDSDNWPGKRVTVWRDPSIQFGAKVVGGLRIKVSTAKKRPAAPAAPPVQEQLPDILDYEEEVEDQAY